MKRTTVNFLCCLVLTPALSLEAIAAEGGAGHEALPADEASLVRYALQHNPELQAARWSSATADAGVVSAAALANPVLHAEWLHAEAPGDYGLGIGVEWSPPAPGVYGPHQDAARADARAVHADLEERAADLEAGVRIAYAEARASVEQLELLDRSVDTRRALREATQARVQRGAANRIDLNLASIGLARGEQARERSALNANASLARLERLIGLGPGQRLELPAPEAVSAVAESSLQSRATNELADRQLVQQALAARPLLRADRERQVAAEQALRAGRAKRWPWIELMARYRRHDQSNYPNDVTLGATLSIPLPGHESGPIAALESDLERAHVLANAHRNELERDIRSLADEHARYAQISAHYSETVAPVLSEHAALVKAALAGLELDLTALFTAEDMVTQGGLEYVQARLATRQAEIALERSLGRYGRGEPGARP